MQARARSLEHCVQVTLFTGLVLAVFGVVLILPTAGLAQDANAPRSLLALPGDAAAAKATAGESYVAEVTGNDVRIRSGAGTNFYESGKLYAGDRVQVVKSQQGWSCIVPPPGCFSWISMQYVSINLQNPTLGVVTGDNVGVYTGSDTQEAKYSTSKQVTLSRGQTVKLLGEEKDDYYKIAPPQGAYLWVSTQYLLPVDKPLAKASATDQAAAKPTVAKKPGDPNEPPGTPVAGLDLYYALSGKVKAELKKPRPEQNYTEIKKKLAELAANKDGGRAARYAQYTLKQVEGYEAACAATKEVDLQKKELDKTTAKIDEARTTRLAQIVDDSKFAVKGKLETSSVYTGTGAAKRYRILDDTGKTICYAKPAPAAASTDLSKLIGQKVGLVGKIDTSQDTGLPLIEFTEMVPLDSSK